MGELFTYMDLFAQTTQTPYIKSAGFTAKARAGFLQPGITFTSLIFFHR